MLAAVFEAVGRSLLIDRVPDPHAGFGELVVRVGACGICGSDLHAASDPDGAFGRPLIAGTILGHEFAGEIVEVGPGAVGRWRIGDRIAAFPIFSCGGCAACSSGRPANCRAARLAGLSGEQGAYAEYARASALHSVPLASSLPYGVAAVAEPLAVCLHAAHLAMPLREAGVLILGAGPIGLLLVACCRQLGARHVVIADVVGERAERGLALGATAAVDATSQDARDVFRSLAGGRPAVIFDAAGGSSTLESAMELAAPGGRIVVVAPARGMSPMPAMTGFNKELSITFAKAYTVGAFREACRLIETGEIDVAPVVTATVGFDRFPAIFASLGRPNTGGKVLLDPLN